MTALNERTPNMPRFETVNVAVVSSSGESARSCGARRERPDLGRDGGKRLPVGIDHRGNEQ